MTARPRIDPIALAVFFGLIAGACLFDRAFFFSEHLSSWSDYASNDILITQAMRGRLLHGNYSRVGFYHPGPFFLQLMAASEWLFFRFAPIFASPIAAHTFGAVTLYSFSLATLAQLLVRTTSSRWIALTAVAVAFSAIQFACGTFLVSPWLPHLCIASAMIVATGAIGCYTLGAWWLPLLTLGCAELIHGHASFIGLVPMMLMALAAAWMIDEWSADRLSTIFSRLADIRLQLWCCAAIIVAFALPIALNTILHWPGEFPKYFKFAQHAQPHTLFEALSYVAQLFPLAPIGAAMLMLPASGAMRRFRFAAAVTVLTGWAAALFYARKGVDTFDFKYMIFWSSAFAGTLLACALASALSLFPSRMSLCAGCVLVLLGCVPTALSSYRAFGNDVNAPLLDVAVVESYPSALKAITAALPDPGMAEIAVDYEHDFAGTWQNLLGLLALDNRQPRRVLCVIPEHWVISYHEQSRCKPSDHVSKHLRLSPVAAPGERVVAETGKTFILELPTAVTDAKSP